MNKVTSKYRPYFIAIIFGIVLISCAILPVFKLLNDNIARLATSESLNNILIGLGTGCITSSIVAYLIDRSASIRNETERNNRKRILHKELSFWVDMFLTSIERREVIYMFLEESTLDRIIIEINRSISLGNEIYSNDEIEVIQSLQLSAYQLKISPYIDEVRNIRLQYPELVNDNLLDDFELRLSNYNRFRNINNLKEVNSQEKTSVEFLLINIHQFIDNLNKYKSVIIDTNVL